MNLSRKRPQSTTNEIIFNGVCSFGARRGLSCSITQRHAHTQRFPSWLHDSAECISTANGQMTRRTRRAIVQTGYNLYCGSTHQLCSRLLPSLLSQSGPLLVRQPRIIEVVLPSSTCQRCHFGHTFLETRSEIKAKEIVNTRLVGPKECTIQWHALSVYIVERS